MIRFLCWLIHKLCSHHERGSVRFRVGPVSSR